jgi:hypothetical protein
MSFSLKCPTCKKLIQWDGTVSFVLFVLNVAVLLILAPGPAVITGYPPVKNKRRKILNNRVDELDI